MRRRLIEPFRTRLPAPLRMLLAACMAVACVSFGMLTPARAGTDCDTSEQVACITLPSSTATPATGSQPGASGNAPAAAALPIPCAPYGCCGPVPLTGAASPGENAAAPVTCPPVPDLCPPYVSGAPATPGGNAVAVPVPPPGGCSPYRSIYSTINLGNAADVRALRTVSTGSLSRYWRQSALAQLQAQVAYLQSVGDYANTQLYSIQVQSATLDLLANTARVQTLEHWLYQERSSYDGSLVTSEDEWVTNNYVLSQSGGIWYITSDVISAYGGPPIIPAGG